MELISPVKARSLFKKRLLFSDAGGRQSIRFSRIGCSFPGGYNSRCKNIRMVNEAAAPGGPE